MIAVERGDLERRLQDFLTRRGLEVVLPDPESTLVESLDAEAPDALLLDLGGSRGGRLALLEQLRANRLYAGLPTFALVDPDVGDAQREKLRQLFAVMVPREDPVGALEDLLGVLFPIAEPTGP